jgi:hypothetical protein
MLVPRHLMPSAAYNLATVSFAKQRDAKLNGAYTNESPIYSIQSGDWPGTSLIGFWGKD